MHHAGITVYTYPVHIESKYTWTHYLANKQTKNSWAYNNRHEWRRHAWCILLRSLLTHILLLPEVKKCLYSNIHRLRIDLLPSGEVVGRMVCFTHKNTIDTLKKSTCFFTRTLKQTCEVKTIFCLKYLSFDTKPLLLVKLKRLYHAGYLNAVFKMWGLQVVSEPDPRSRRRRCEGLAPRLAYKLNWKPEHLVMKLMPL